MDSDKSNTDSRMSDALLSEYITLMVPLIGRISNDPKYQSGEVVSELLRTETSKYQETQ